MDRKVFLMALINSCPLKSIHPNCPIEVFRQFSLSELVEKNKELSDNEILELTQQHVECRKKRESLLLRKERSKREHNDCSVSLI